MTASSAHGPVAAIACIGGCVIDRFGETADGRERLYTSNVGQMRRSMGGVARNVAENLARLALRVSLVSRIGDDPDGRDLVAGCTAAGIGMEHVVVDPGQRTASYTAIFNGEGELVIGLADMAVFERIDPMQVLAALGSTHPDSLVFIDANLPERTLVALAAARSRRRLVAGPVSQQKVLRLAPCLKALDTLVLNRYEAQALTGIEATDQPAQASALRALGVRQGLLTAGPADAIAWSDTDVRTITPPPATVVNVNGGGDALIAGLMAHMALGAPFFDAVRFGMSAAALTVESPLSVRADISMALVLAHRAGQTG